MGIIEEVKREIEELESRLEQLRTVLAYHEKRLGVRITAEDRAGAAAEILMWCGKPMTMYEIVEALQTAGFGLDSSPRRLYRSLHMTMSRKPNKFVHEGNKWGLAQWRDNVD